MAKKIKITDFIYPCAIVVCNTSANAVNGYYPEIARITQDRKIEWKRKRITPQMKEHVEKLANTPFLRPAVTAEYNFFNCEPKNEGV